MLQGALSQPTNNMQQCMDSHKAQVDKPSATQFINYHCVLVYGIVVISQTLL